MYFYEVAPASAQYHGQNYLTYSYMAPLKDGQIVTIPLRQNACLGLIIKEVPRPTYKTKEIVKLNLAIALPKPTLDFFFWLKTYYPAPLGLITQQFLPKFLSKELPETKLPKPAKTQILPPLTTEQSTVLSEVGKAKAASYLLHGETGSGKTRVYIELAKNVLTNGRSALILTPEIVLTPQLVKNFEDVFPGQVLVTHSNLTPKQRAEVWATVINNGRPLVIIGPRSALFLPFANLGLIAMDEAHEPAYKNEQSPNYQTTRAASALSNLHKATLILGSATPLVTDYYLAKQKGVPILRMASAATKTTRASKDIKIVDLKDRQQFARYPFLSKPLVKAIEQSLKNNEQVLLFLNRRGSAQLVLCVSCGWQALCARCGLPLVYHGDSHSLRCHTCGYEQQTPPGCPVCGSVDIIFKGVGTKQLEQNIKKLFPSAKVHRFDTDNLKAERFEAHYASVKSGEVDILIGTQILAKGLDLPKLGLVGIIVADSGLSFPDYTAEERTYQLLSQISGRVGRGHRHGQVIIQTYNPKNPLLMQAFNNDWQEFYNLQLTARQSFGFPPFNHVVKLKIRSTKRANAEANSKQLAENLRQTNPKIAVVGPSPAFKEKTAGHYTWQIIIKTKSRQRLIDVTKDLPAGWTYDLDPSDLL